MARVVVTGGSGKVGRACVEDLLGHGYEVVDVDTVPPAVERCPFVRADLTDFGQTLEVLSEVDDRLRDIDALVHLAAIPAPSLVRKTPLRARTATIRVVTQNPARKPTTADPGRCRE